MLLSPIFTGHCQGQLLWIWQNPALIRLRGYHPLFRYFPVHFSFDYRILYAISVTPHLYYVTITDSVWAVPLSLAATNGISIDFSSSSYSDASLRTVRPPKRKQGSVIERSHSEILGSMVACTYPKLIAACHVLPHLSSRVILQPASSHQFVAFIDTDSQSWKITRTYVKQFFFIYLPLKNFCRYC